VKILLAREEVNPDKLDNSHRTPLTNAAGRGHEGVVQNLLEREGVHPDRPTNFGLAPLSIAAMFGQVRVAALLRSRKTAIPCTI